MSEEIADGTRYFNGGQDAWQNPDRIRPECYVKGVNTSSKKSILQPRPSFREQPIRFENRKLVNAFGYTRTIKDLFQSGLFQAAIPYKILDRDYLVLVIGGLIYRYSINTSDLILMSEDIKVSQFSPRINWSVAGRFLVLADFPDNCVIIDDKGEVTRASYDYIASNGFHQPQIPPSTVITYNQGRLFAANAGVEFIAGDPVGTGIFPEAPVTFTETLLPGQNFTGQAFSLGTNHNDEAITAMGFLQVIDASTGIGPLFVATENSIYYYRTDLPRLQWELESFGSLLLYNAGIKGPRAFVNVNSDLVFLSADNNVYSLSMSRNDFQKWGHVPMSKEVDNWLSQGERDLVKHSFLSYFDNTILVSAIPYRVTAYTREMQPINDTAFRGVVALSLDNISTLSQQSNPVWEGLWTGINPLDAVTIDGRLFIIGKGQGSINGIYELDPKKTYDFIEGREQNIRTVVYTREYTFDKYAQQLKNIKSLEVSVQKIKGNLKLKIEYRPSHSEEFKLWKKWEHDAPDRQCSYPVEFPNGLSSHNFRELNFGGPEEDGCDPIFQDNFETFKKLQLRITIEARDWEIDEVVLYAKTEMSSHTITPEICTKRELVEIPKQCNDDLSLPNISNC